jgi:hypothetical protein
VLLRKHSQRNETEVACGLVQMRLQHQSVQVHDARRKNKDARKRYVDCIHAPVQGADEQRGSQRQADDGQIRCDERKVVQRRFGSSLVPFRVHASMA